MTGPDHPMGVTEPGAAVFFLSDYGTADEFVGVVHAVLRRLAPSAPVIDLSHQIPPYDVAAGAALLVRAGPHLGPGAVLAVVDPGVGSDRRAVALELPSGGPTWLVGPDNGLLVPLASSLGPVRSAVTLDADRIAGPSRAGTFDGRDLFAPAVAHLVRGGEATAIGTPVDPASLVAAPAVPAAPESGGPGGPIDTSGSEPVAVTWVDRFGNVQLDLVPATLSALGLAPGATARITLGPEGGGRSRPARWVVAYAELAPGELGLLEDANGRMALVLDRDSAAVALGVEAPGSVVRIGTAGSTRD